MIARKDNVTGVKRLSIGTTTNGKGNALTRYVINLPTADGQLSKSFYFGVNTSQRDAFKNAIRFLKDHESFNGTLKDAENIYREFNHERLLSCFKNGTGN